MHNTVQPKNDKITVTFRPPVRIPHAGLGQSTRFKDRRKLSRTTAKVQMFRD